MTEEGSPEAAGARSYLFALNPNASGVDSIDALKSQISEAMAGADCRFVTPESAEAVAGVIEAALAEQPADVLVGVGGDGAARMLIPIALKHAPLALGIIPMGTGNLLASALNIPAEVEGACEVLLHGERRRMHLGALNNGEFFTLAVGVGIDATIMKQTSSERKKALGGLAYVLEGIRQIFRARVMTMDIWIDDQRLRRQASGVMIINHRDFLTSFNPFSTPSQENLEDEWLDVCILDLSNPLAAIPSMLQLMTQDFSNPLLPLEHFRGKRVRVKTRPVTAVQADGDVIGKTPLDVTIREECLPFIMRAAASN